MKKLKRIFAALMVCAVALSCAGCAELDEIKECHAIYTDETREEILWKGHNYKQLPGHPLLEIRNYAPYNIHLTKADVPALLSKRFGQSANCSQDEILLDRYYSDKDSSILYGREDYYDAIIAEMNAGPILDQIDFDFYDYRQEKHRKIALSDARIAAVEQILETEPVFLGDDGYNEDYAICLNRCSKSGFFREYLGWISVLDGEYRLICNGDGGDWCYSIPQELLPTVQEIIKPYEDTFFGE